MCQCVSACVCDSVCVRTYVCGSVDVFSLSVTHSHTLSLSLSHTHHPYIQVVETRLSHADEDILQLRSEATLINTEKELLTTASEDVAQKIR